MIATMPTGRVKTVSYPVATISPYVPMERGRKPSGLSGEFWMAEDFDETPFDVIDDFEGAFPSP